MTVEIKVPPLGESVTEATIAGLKKKVGDFVKMDELLLELETEKVTLEVNAPASGKLTDLQVADGDTVEVDAVIGSIDESAEGDASSDDKGSKDKEESADKDKAADKEEKSEGQTSEAVHSPAAQKIAKENNLDIKEGSGKDGRVTKEDALKAKAGESASSKKSSSSAPADKASREERVRMTKLRQKIAQRLKESQDTAAILTTFNEIDMTNVMALRSEYKEHFLKKHDVKLGFMSFFTKAAIAALKEIPSVNAEVQGNEIVYKNYYDIGMAVGTPQGLVVPVVRDADELTFAGIESTIVGLGKKARDGKLTMADMTGGTFTISNGGVYGSLLSTPIINPPQTGILGLHKIQERPMAVNGEVKIRPMMYVALSYDHRLIDGSEAVTFLVRVKEAMEDPQRLLLEV